MTVKATTPPGGDRRRWVKPMYEVVEDVNDTENCSTEPAKNQPRKRRSNPLLAAALRYAELGLPVFPAAGKTPLTKRGFKDASTDADTIKAWWKTHPSANIGIPTGKPSGLAVLDTDIGGNGDRPKRGDLTLAALEAEHGELPPTPISDTGGGGVHYFFKRPGAYKVKSGSDVFGKWLDCRGDGGYVVVPPSVTGKTYRWRGRPDFNNLAELPDWLAVSVVENAPQPASNGTRHVPGDVDLELVRAALDAMPANDREIWLKVGMALHSIGQRELWDRWSERSDKYGERDQNKVWKSFNGSGVTVASIFELAQRHGWQHPLKRNVPPAGHSEQQRKVAAPRLSGGDSVSPPESRLLIRRAVDAHPKPIRWLWPMRVALGKLTLIAGDPGLGKSFLSVAMAATVSTGGRWPVDGTCAPLGDVLILSAEDDLQDTIRPRLDAAGADVRRVQVIEAVAITTEDGVQRKMFSLVKDLAALDDVLADMPDCKLLTVDPISAYMDGTDSHKNTDVRALLAQLADLAAKHDVAVVAVSHLNKSGGPAAYRVTGSIAFTAAPRAAYAVTKDAENP